MAAGDIARGARGYVLTGDDVVKAGRWTHNHDPYLLESSAPGIFACGDVRLSPVKRVASAVGEPPRSERAAWRSLSSTSFCNRTRGSLAAGTGPDTLLPNSTFTKVNPGRIRSLLSGAYLSNEVTLSVDAFLVNTGTKLVLIDTGTGTSQMFGSKLGSLLSNLRASGCAPEQVDEIYVTHMHTDHSGGLMRDGEPSFTNATVRAGVRAERIFRCGGARRNSWHRDASRRGRWLRVGPKKLSLRQITRARANCAATTAELQGDTRMWSGGKSA